MPLPISGTAWPPLSWQPAYAEIARNDAWLSGSTAETTAPGNTGFASQIRSLFSGSSGQGSSFYRVHVPVAKGISRMSATILFGELFKATFSDDGDADDTVNGQIDSDVYDSLSKRVGELLNDHSHSALLEGAEYASAHGGVYYRVSWDKAVEPNGAFITVRAADTAIPTFSFGRLANVIFWDRLSNIANQRYTLLEMHEPGSISWGLYESGADRTLGKQVPLSVHPDTRSLAGRDGTSALTVSIPTGTQRLTAVYMPNSRPNLAMRHDAVAYSMGRSDYEQVGDLFQMLDDTMTSWERDFRLGKTRVIVPKNMMKIGAPGSGGAFDADQELFVEMGGDPVGAMNTGDGGGPLQVIQPVLRETAHRATAEYLFDKIYTTSGYSAQSFGEEGDVVRTATEISSKEKLTLSTRANKIVSARPVMADLICALIDVDYFVFPERGVDRHDLDPMIEFPDAVGEDSETTAKVLLTLSQADAISTEQKVRRQYPKWDDAAVDQEVRAIKAENQIATSETDEDINPIDPETDAVVPATPAPVASGDEVTN